MATLIPKKRAISHNTIFIRIIMRLHYILNNLLIFKHKK